MEIKEIFEEFETNMKKAKEIAKEKDQKLNDLILEIQEDQRNGVNNIYLHIEKLKKIVSEKELDTMLKLLSTR